MSGPLGQWGRSCLWEDSQTPRGGKRKPGALGVASCRGLAAVEGEGGRGGVRAQARGLQ